jgi:hypothetical protein
MYYIHDPLRRDLATLDQVAAQIGDVEAELSRRCA